MANAKKVMDIAIKVLMGLILALPLLAAGVGAFQWGGVGSFYQVGVPGLDQTELDIGAQWFIAGLVLEVILIAGGLGVRKYRN